MNKTVPVALPEWVWGRLATIASHRDTKVGDLVAASVVSILTEDTGRLAQLEADLRAARRAGYQTPKVRAAKNRSNT